MRYIPVFLTLLVPQAFAQNATPAPIRPTVLPSPQPSKADASPAAASSRPNQKGTTIAPALDTDPDVSAMSKEEEKEEDRKKKLKELEDKANETPPKTKAILELGVCYYYGRLGLEKDAVKAAELWRKGSDLNNRQCMFNLAGLYWKGEGVERSADEALKLFQKAADFGFGPANINAAQILDGRGEYESARPYYDNAVEISRDMRAVKRLAAYSEQGLGGPKDIPKAVKLYRIGAENGDSFSQLKMADFYINGTGMAEPNPQEAMQWVMRAADNGAPEAEARMGWCYQNGQGVRKDNQVGVRWLQRAADQNFSPAQVALGNCYAVGRGVPADMTEAVRWYEKASKDKNPQGLYNLGACKANGNGCKVDLPEALKLYRQAADVGYAQAQFVLGRMYLEGKEIKQDLVMAQSLIQLAALQDHPDALCELGRCYLTGVGVKVDLLQAEKFLLKSAECGSDEGYALYQKNFGKSAPR